MRVALLWNELWTKRVSVSEGPLHRSGAISHRLSNIAITVGSAMLADKLGAFQSGDMLSVESIGDYSYGDDSDLEDEDDTEDFNVQHNESTSGEDTHTATRRHTPSIGSDDTQSRLVHTSEGTETAAPTEDFVSVSASGEDDSVGEHDRQSTRTSAPANASGPQEQQCNGRRTYLRFDETPAIIMTDTAFRT